jgi:hypothetical protein
MAYSTNMQFLTIITYLSEWKIACNVILEIILKRFCGCSKSIIAVLFAFLSFSFCNSALAVGSHLIPFGFSCINSGTKENNSVPSTREKRNDFCI